MIIDVLEIRSIVLLYILGFLFVVFFFFFFLYFVTLLYFWVIWTFLMHAFKSFHEARRNAMKLSEINERLTAPKKINFRHIWHRKETVKIRFGKVFEIISLSKVDIIFLEYYRMLDCVFVLPLSLRESNYSTISCLVLKILLWPPILPHHTSQLPFTETSPSFYSHATDYSKNKSKVMAIFQMPKCNENVYQFSGKKLETWASNVFKFNMSFRVIFTCKVSVLDKIFRLYRLQKNY